MDINRRDFLKVAAGGGLAVAANLSPVPVLAREATPRLPEAVGLLYDATVCVGCRACMVACKEVNHLPPVFTRPNDVWDNPMDLSDKTFNIIKLYKNGMGVYKDQEINGYSFIKRSCMHCVDPACTSACPVSAMTKDPATGIVKYNKDACIGCRYCQVACPYNIPKFQWGEAFPQIMKCELCSPRIEKGGYPACAEFCPNGGTIFGEVRDLLKEARRRLALKTGEVAAYPLHRVDSQEKRYRTATAYQKRIYGEKEGGGTQVLMLAGVPYGKLGLPALPNESPASASETLMHTLYKGMIGPYVLLGGLFYLIYKNTGKQDLP
jgi:Fe-S-cluster-containing dehydrogenase component